jgi:hypothetical protein
LQNIEIESEHLSSAMREASKPLASGWPHYLSTPYLSHLPVISQHGEQNWNWSDCLLVYSIYLLFVSIHLESDIIRSTKSRRFWFFNYVQNKSNSVKECFSFFNRLSDENFFKIAKEIKVR